MLSKKRKVTVELTVEAWQTILRAADNGAWSSDVELLELIFPDRSQRGIFLRAFRKINNAIDANYAPNCKIGGL